MLTLLLSSPELESTTTPGIALHGYVSQGVIKSTDNNYLARSIRGSFEMADAALNLTAPLGENLSAGMQLYARDLGPLGNYNAKFDWFHLDWRPHDAFALRAGRVRMPFGLYNASSDYDPARVAILLPQSLYPVTSRELLLAVTGTQVYGVLDLGPLGLLDYSAYAGAIYVDITESSQPLTAGNPYTAGGRVLLEPISGLRFGGSVMALRLDLSSAVPPIHLKVPALLWAASVEYIIDNVRLAAEYSRWDVEIQSSNEVFIPNTESNSERYYVLGTIELTTWLQVGAYYSALFPDEEAREGAARYQHDTAATLRFDINPHWLIKLEGHYMHGTAALSPVLNPGPPEELDETWGLFLAKTTAYF